MKFLKQTDCFSCIMTYWKLLGINPMKVESRFYKLYSKIIVLLFTILYDVLSTINFYYLPRKLELFIEEMIFYFMELAVMSKVLTFIFKQKKIIKILEILDSEDFQPKNEKEMHILKEAMNFSVKYWKYDAATSYFCHFVHILSPIIFHLLLLLPLVPPTCSYAFLSESLIHEYIYPIYLYQGIGMHFVMLNNLNIDTFFVGLMILFQAHLDIIEKNLQLVAYSKSSINNNDNNTIESETNNDLNFIKELNNLIVHYDKICKLCILIGNVFSVTLFMQISMASCIICACLLRFTMPAPVHYYVFLGTYSVIMTLQVFFPCWFGSGITLKSSALSQAIYACDWTKRSRRFKSNLKIFVERANRALSISGLKIFPLSLETFTSIMNCAYSFYTLLRHMQTRD